MIETICPECGEKIGGRDHTLLKTNKLVDFDLDVKNNINITPVKVIKNKENEDKDNTDNKPEQINNEKEKENKEKDEQEKQNTNDDNKKEE